MKCGDFVPQSLKYIYICIHICIPCTSTQYVDMSIIVYVNDNDV